ncbi:Hypothetical protein R9X50_00460600 [Acrodontium crateriforme]|uniref:Uncharacterized protein n=1 Tax=Acrodontium crateriforme TaxID=150365 RepID=A0AAQ3R8I3_9PEZI|nr:Hypothetical protein R9X50_00460600 [Acrodontium crateriforme]
MASMNCTSGMSSLLLRTHVSRAARQSIRRSSTYASSILPQKWSRNSGLPHSSIKTALCSDSIRRAFQNYGTRSYRTGQRRSRPAITADREHAAHLESNELATANNLESVIKVVDFSVERLVKHEVASNSLSEFLKTQKKPSWAACRWIYVNGLNQDVAKSLGAANSLHRLEIEDIIRNDTPTKTDFYNDHFFVSLPFLKLVCLHGQGQESKRADFIIQESDFHSHDPRHRKWAMLSSRQHTVSLEQTSLVLTADSTLITMFDRSGQEVFDTIFEILESQQTILRTSNDPSMLLHAVIDAIVDLSLPIGKAFKEAFQELEVSVLMKPSIAQSRQLYTLRSELIALRDVIIPVGSVVRMLREHYASPNTTPPSQSSQVAASNLVSPMARTYLADVQDNVEILSRSTHSTIRSSENLTALIFNTIAAKQNESVRQLTFVSIFFLPLTFLTGYFGMNFDPMPIVNDNSDAIFWYIATPVMLTSLLFVATRAAWARYSFHRQQRRIMAARAPRHHRG